ncbi:hypothetical protein BGZ99_006530 [Dissophora globulifera]|uniref:Gated mechanosensitive channel n=1 Tax=Dissophora globulifera TaxID=979702 RepID=A0A9P6USA4_9FUNG|nr:hypothetical protein BGZ99_006530 [Dissophora globulifera]
MSNDINARGAEYELETQDDPNYPSVQSRQSFYDNGRKKIAVINPVKAVKGGISQVKGGISQVEKGVNNVGNTLNKVPGVKHGVSFFADYRKFMDRGNVIDLAVAVVIGAAFTAIVTSLVTDIITPIIALASGKNLEENFVILRHNHTASTQYYATRDLAHAEGNITWNWGNFIQTVINFFIISGCVFLIVKVYQVGRNTKTEITEKSCDYCLKKVALNSVRCPECTTWLDWDACAKAALMERIATNALTANSYPGSPVGVAASSFVDYPAAQSSVVRF